MAWRFILLITSLMTVGFGSQLAIAEDEGAAAPAATAAAEEGESQISDAVDTDADDSIVDEPLKEPARSPRKQNVRRSRLTKDLTEAKADRRRLAIGVAEDKIVDLDFDIYAGEPWSINSNGKSVGIQRIKTDASGGRKNVFRGTPQGVATVSGFQAHQRVRFICFDPVTDKNLFSNKGGN